MSWHQDGLHNKLELAWGEILSSSPQKAQAGVGVQTLEHRMSRGVSHACLSICTCVKNFRVTFNM